MSKIGKQILIMSNSLLILVVVAVATVFLTQFIRVENSNLQSSAGASTNVLRSNFHEKEDDIKMLSALLADDEELLNAITDGSTSYIESIWNKLEKSDAIFLAITNAADGKLIYRSDNCPVDEKEVMDGLINDTVQLRTVGTDVMYSRYASLSDRDQLIIVGYSYSSNEIVDNLMSQTKNHATIFCKDIRLSTTMTTESGERSVGTKMNSDVYEKVVKNGENYNSDIDIFGEKYMTNYEPLKDENGNIIGALFTGKPMEDSLKNRGRVVMLSIIVACIMLALSGGIFIGFIIKHISGPISNVKNVAVEMSNGNLRNNPGITFALEDNEIGELAGALTSAVKTLDSYIGDISEMMEEMSHGNFGVTSKVNYKGDFISIGKSAADLREQMKNVIMNINASADSVYNGSEQVSNIAGIIADGTTKQAAASEELTASIAEISNNIVRNSESAVKAQEFSHISINNINSQSEQIANMLEAMKNIENSTNEISKIIKSIEDIAFQTNILALNAAVEAARAGEAGKGFAVVADEVRNLANKSAAAAANTSSLIENCIEAVSNGSAMAQKTADAMTVVVENATNTNNLIDDIGKQTAIQAEAVKQVQSGVDMISDVIQQNSATAEESSANCQDLNTQAMTLREQISIFRV